jgi:hypothetical protein
VTWRSQPGRDWSGQGEHAADQARDWSGIKGESYYALRGRLRLIVCKVRQLGALITFIQRLYSIVSMSCVFSLCVLL